MAKTKVNHLPPGICPAGLDLPQAAEFVGVSPNTFVKMVKDGAMPLPRCFGARRIWIRAEIEAGLSALPIPSGEFRPGDAEGSAQ